MKRKISQITHLHPIEYLTYDYDSDTIGKRSEPKFAIGRIKYINDGDKYLAVQLIPHVPNLSNASHPREGETFAKILKKSKKGSKA